MERFARFILLALAGACANGADPAPEFAAAGVAKGFAPVLSIEPGDEISIYGHYLGPLEACEGQADARAASPAHPTELCGTQVLIGGEPAGLLSVSEKLINLDVPRDMPEGGDVEIRVVRLGQTSAPLRVKAGFERATVSLEQPAYTDMAVWLKVEMPQSLGGVSYPGGGLGPAGFGCSEVEVRKDGKALPILPGSNWRRYIHALGGSDCGSFGPNPHQGRLPLHLVYRFAAPGVYEVRYTLWNFLLDDKFTPRQVKARSEWTPIEVRAPAPGRRADWLEGVRKSAPADRNELLTDILPSLLGIPDDASLEILLPYLYHPDASVRRYAMYGLTYWPDDFAVRRLRALAEAKGTNDVVAQYLTFYPYGTP